MRVCVGDLPFQVRRQFEAHCRSFEARIRGKASRAIAMWRGIAMQNASSSNAAALSLMDHDDEDGSPGHHERTDRKVRMLTPLRLGLRTGAGWSDLAVGCNLCVSRARSC